LLNTFKEIVSVRQNFWNEHIQQLPQDDNFKDFNRITVQERIFDLFLLCFFEEEVAYEFQDSQTSRRTTLGLISLVNNDAFFNQVEEKIDRYIPLITGLNGPELKQRMFEVILAAEKLKNAQFIQNLSEKKETLSTRSYELIAEQYTQIISKFEKVAQELNRDNATDIIEKWNQMLKEFDLQLKLFLELYTADQALQNFSKETFDTLNGLKNDQASSAFEELNHLSEFLNKKNVLKDFKEIQDYIDNVNSFIQKGLKILKTS
jgi:hypothetical protein